MKRLLICAFGLAFALSASDAFALGRRNNCSSGCSSNGCQVRTAAPAPSVVAPPVAPTPAPDESSRLELKRLINGPEALTMNRAAGAKFCAVARPVRNERLLSVFASNDVVGGDLISR